MITKSKYLRSNFLGLEYLIILSVDLILQDFFVGYIVKLEIDVNFSLFG